MTDPDDPLRGLDPYPRERIEGLHRERAELLEEIVSTPTPGKQPARTKLLLAGGIAAALVLVGGGAWIAVTGDDTENGQVAAGTASPTTATDTTESTAAASPSDTATDQTSQSPAPVTLAHARKGDVLPRAECRKARNGRWIDVMTSSRSGELYGLTTGHRGQRPEVRGHITVNQMKRRMQHVVLVSREEAHGRWIALDGDCKVVAVGRGGGPMRLAGLLSRHHR